ncbi:MAG TPA: ElyC/SanA/YdcF family protein [Aequorivita sp.]|nr:ElyC/SanA/YdcF family protein [Aequorivita sp.]
MIKKALIWGLVLLVVGTSLLVFTANFSIQKAAEGKTFSSVTTIPKNRVGLLLGTAKYYKDGGINLYFKYRIDAAVELYNSNKIDFILVSGDNSSMQYNEPMTFKNELVKRGIPKEVIFLDYAGFRTLDSVIRAKEIFGQAKFTVISQKFQNERAIYLAEMSEIVVVGFNAKDVKGSGGYKVKFREYFARTKAFLDVIFHVEPKFYGEKIEIGKIDIAE